MAFKSVLPPYAERPRYQGARAGAQRLQFYSMRENFSISTWMLLGALVQGVVVLMVPRFYAVLPSVVVLVARLAQTVAITLGWQRNHYLDDAIMHRVAPQIPDADGQFHEEASDEKVVVFMLGAKSNHPMGLFAPNFKKLSDELSGMMKELDGDNDRLGFYGGTNWTNQDANGATEFLLLSYWRSTEDVHNFAYGPTHRATWEWWNRIVGDSPHIGINHEIFEVDRKHWEAVYVNFQPTMLGATTYLRRGDKLIGGVVDDAWVSPLVDARRGKLRTSAGRLGRDPHQLYEKHGGAPTGEYW